MFNQLLGLRSLVRTDCWVKNFVVRLVIGVKGFVVKLVELQVLTFGQLL